MTLHSSKSGSNHIALFNDQANKAQDKKSYKLKSKTQLFDKTMQHKSDN